ncbi:MAG: hypothetical protein DCC67_02975 [Planctomycetota bacterium]|nr:MAG: hypothetical protein DCC67_02975 [Planctomycetota bacterium]
MPFAMPLIWRTLGRPAFTFAAISTALAAWAAADWYLAYPREALQQARYVGRQSCMACHQEAAAAWTGSDHDRAMEIATDETVMGNFDDVEFRRFDERTRFFRDGRKFMVNAEGPDGQYRDYQIKYTFGVRPLQQYVVELPGGRLQVLRVSWDVAKQEWFYVAPADAQDVRIPAGDPLHWTGLAQNWNTMCAECHTTDYHKNYDLAADKYASTYSEIDVSCESCHGPGSLHVKLAEGKSLFWDRTVRFGLTNTLQGASAQREMETCAPCHSRRAIIHADYRAGDSFLDHFEPSLLSAGLYHADGQILDEVFEYGSFTQSKMYHKGVGCTDCHDPHSLQLKYEGNRLCAQCHQPGKYDGAGHHHHPNAAPNAPETQCVTCHMPGSVYMGIDERSDHNIRIPRPDLTTTVDSPNVCNRCHVKEEEDAKWAADAIVRWYGPKRPDDPHYAPAIDAARRGHSDAIELIHGLLRRNATPDIVRATAVELLGNYHSEQSQRLCQEALKDPSPLVRAAAVRSFATRLSQLDERIKELRDPAAIDDAASIEMGQARQALAKLAQRIAPTLNDRVRGVRLAAANVLAACADELKTLGFGSALERAIVEYRAAQSLHLERAQANRNLAALSLRLGDKAAAIEQFRTAIRQEPYLTGLRTELSQALVAVLDDPGESKTVAKAGVTREEVARLRQEEVDLLERDYHLLPSDPAPRFQRGRLLYLLNRGDEAREAFAEACRLAPDNYEYWMWLALICERQERWEEAAGALLEMRRLRPDGAEWRGIRTRMRETIRGKGLLPAVAPSQPSADSSAAAGVAAQDATLQTAPAPQPVAPEPPGTPGRKASPPSKE